MCQQASVRVGLSLLPRLQHTDPVGGARIISPQIRRWFVKNPVQPGNIPVVQVLGHNHSQWYKRFILSFWFLDVSVTTDWDQLKQRTFSVVLQSVND